MWQSMCPQRIAFIKGASKVDERLRNRFQLWSWMWNMPHFLNHACPKTVCPHFGILDDCCFDTVFSSVTMTLQPKKLWQDEALIHLWKDLFSCFVLGGFCCSFSICYTSKPFIPNFGCWWWWHIITMTIIISIASGCFCASLFFKPLWTLRGEHGKLVTCQDLCTQ